MTVRSPYQVHAITSPFFGERPPRGYTRQDRVDLNLFDAGHGNPSISQNPILLGLGVTLRLRLNQHVRTWKVFVWDATGTEVEITSQFKEVAARMFELRGVAGAGAFNPDSRLPAEWVDQVTLNFRVETTNITLTSEFVASMTIQDGDDIRSCPDACQIDFHLMRELHKLRIRLWRDVIEPERQPRDVATNTGNLIYLFDQAESLKNMSAALCDCYNYYDLVMIGVTFFLPGDCEIAARQSYPNAADCNPWAGELPTSNGVEIILPGGWELTGCP